MQIISTSGHTTYGLQEFVLVNEDEVSKLPVDCVAGSSALVITTGNLYMYNGTDWVQLGAGEE